MGKIFVLKEKKKKQYIQKLERTGEGIGGIISTSPNRNPNTLEDEDVYNPSIRGKRRNISWIIRCPNRKSKISIGTCRECSFFGGIVDNCVICSWRREKK